MKVRWSSSGDFKSSISLMQKFSKIPYEKRLNNVGKLYVNAIRANTPTRTGELANGFDYSTGMDNGKPTVSIFNNSHIEWPQLVVGLEYGHGTGTGGYVPGTHFVSRASKSIESQVSKEVEGVIIDVK